MGIAHGAFCVGCCWSLMLVMFGVGLGSVVAMLALGAITAVEKNLPWGRRLTRPLGVLLILAAVYAVACVSLWGRMLVGTWTRTAAVPETRAERRERATADTRASILAAARRALLADGYANLSTRAVAEAAEVPAQPDPLPLRQQAAAHPGGPRGRERAPARAPARRCSPGPSRSGASGIGPATSSTRTSSRATSGSSRR